MSAPVAQVYRERLTPPAWFAAAALGVAALAAGELVSGHGGLRAVLGWSLVPLALLGVLALARRTVEVAGGELRVPGATVPLTALGDVEPLDRRAAALARGRGRAPGAFVPAAPGVPTALRVELLDPADRVPHWVVPTRRPDALAAAVRHR